MIVEFHAFKKYKYCMNCCKSFTKNCKRCSVQIVFKGLKILSDEKTLDEIIIHNKSISRYGDGEFLIIFGNSIKFQKKDVILKKRLIEILKINDKNFLIGINLPYRNKDLKKLIEYSKNYWYNFVDSNKFKIVKLLNKTNIYYSSTISRFYFRYKKKKNIPKYIKKLKKIWEQKDILIIEGEKSRVGIGNDLFNNSKSIKRIICPNFNAFKVYNKIIKAVLTIKEKRLILIALGPTATVLAYDLYKLGYQSIDIGHLDIEYEWFLRNASSKIAIENKIVIENHENNNTFTKIRDEKYYKQIIAKILS